MTSVHAIGEHYYAIVDGVKVHTYEVDQAARSFPTFGELALMYSCARAATR